MSYHFHQEYQGCEMFSIVLLMEFHSFYNFQFSIVSVIFITHRLQDIFKVCDRVMVMYEGKKVADKLIHETSLQDLVNLIVAEH